MAKNAPKTAVETAATPATDWQAATLQHYTTSGHPIKARIVLPGFDGADGYYCTKQADGTLVIYAFAYKAKVVPSTVDAAW